VKRLFIGVLLISCSTVTSAQQWHPVASSFCSQIKAKGAKISGRPFSIFEVSGSESRCCEGLSLKAKGKTEDFGHFRVLDLDQGHYFLSFDRKTKQVNVPILVGRHVDKRYFAKECEPTSRITVDKVSNRVSWEEWVIVD